MSKHTPGPWYADKLQDRNAYNIFQYGGTSALLTIGGIGSDVEANARLIAAAPDMLNALKLIVESGDRAAVEIARAAIAKAENKHD